MEEPHGDLMDTNDLADRVMNHIEGALAASDVPEMQMHLREAMAFGEQMEIRLADSAFEIEDHDTVDEIEQALSSLRRFFRLGVQALSGDEAALTQLPQLRGVEGRFHARKRPLDPRFLHYIS